MDYEQMNNNQVVLSGTIKTDLVLTHRVCGEGFFESILEVRRLSDQVDMIPITISERLILEHNLKVNDSVSIHGQFRSYNKQDGERSRLMLTMFVREILQEELAENPNVIYVNGYVCKPPIYRTTPFNREICDILVAVNRAYNKSDYLPCICWGRNAKFARNIQIGDNVALIGRIQSRNYIKKLNEEDIQTHTAYEVSVSKFALADQFAFIENDNSYRAIQRAINKDSLIGSQQSGFLNEYNTIL